MPELPEVETIVRGLKEKLPGQKIRQVKVNLDKVLRENKEEFASLLTGLVFQGVSRRGKMIIFDLSEDWSLVVHLKMTGQIIYTRPEAPVNKHTHLVFDLAKGNQLRYADLRQFGYLILLKTDQVTGLPQLAGLGPDALEISSQEFGKLIASRKGAIKPLLLNQSFLAGLGNIYSDEVLHLAQIHPLQPAGSLTSAQIERLYKAIRQVLTRAIKLKGSSVSNYVDSDGERGSFQELHQVYGREGKPCFQCGQPVKRLKLSSRSTCFCPSCQKLKALDRQE
ncbi:MAG: bifunctional DNA-formamidopyrimidine glycosylase/DNA-(apurinic or apyrimidinic site) lyase [bacterium]|nr:bifunctional DNA-formamidopyrimidine glycosylase/DNA-(apurinic or apyrimidinic site) lyase [bacterium]